MRNIAEIIEDDKNGKQLSQTERQIAVAYIQGKYDAVRELKIGNNNTMEVLDKIRAEIEQEYNRLRATRVDETIELGECLGLKMSLKIIDKYKAEGGGEE